MRTLGEFCGALREYFWPADDVVFRIRVACALVAIAAAEFIVYVIGCAFITEVNGGSFWFHPLWALELLIANIIIGAIILFNVADDIASEVRRRNR